MGAPYVGCTELLLVRTEDHRGQLRIAFAAGPGRVVSDGFMHGGGIALEGEGGGYLNLNEPGVVRAFVDAAMATGWTPGDTVALDGWTLVPEVVRARATAAAARSPQKIARK
jgi:hypothetical protein